MKWFENMTKQELYRRFGSPEQLAGVKRYTIREGRADGLDAVDVRTGCGLNFTVLPGRGMDIAQVEYDGKPIAFISKGGLVHSAYYYQKDFHWLYSFFAGMLTTCGLTNAGDPCKDSRFEQSIHGRISNQPADHVCISEEWEGDEYVLRVKGTVRDAVMFQENLVMTREIVAKLGSKTIEIRNKVENRGFDKTPFMLMFHMNFGYPVVSEDSVLYAAIEEREGNDPQDYRHFTQPVAGIGEKVFFHEAKADAQGNTAVGIVNEKTDFGAYIAYNKNELPNLTEWKMMGAQDYVVGIEPGNCNPIGRDKAEEQGVLHYLEAGETFETTVTLGILDGREEIDAFAARIAQLNK